MAKWDPITQRELDRYRELRARSKNLTMSERSEMNRLKIKLRMELNPEDFVRKGLRIDLTALVLFALAFIWAVVSIASQAVGLLSRGA